MNVKPFMISFVGCISDYVTTQIGLSKGFYETHVLYHPITALVIFTIANLVLALTIQDKRFNIAKYLIASLSFLGAINNILVILGVFGGLTI